MEIFQLSVLFLSFNFSEANRSIKSSQGRLQIGWKAYDLKNFTCHKAGLNVIKHELHVIKHVLHVMKQKNESCSKLGNAKFGMKIFSLSVLFYHFNFSEANRSIKSSQVPLCVLCVFPVCSLCFPCVLPLSTFSYQKQKLIKIMQNGCWQNQFCVLRIFLVNWEFYFPKRLVRFSNFTKTIQFWRLS